jgi:flagellar assembly factor FliW
MKIQSRPFGEVEIDENRILTIQGGMFGFEGYDRFVLIGVQEQKPFEWVQCVDEPTLAFVVLRPDTFMPGYQLVISDADKSALGVKSESELLCYVICVIPDDMKKITVNLKGPIVINSGTRQGRQTISLVENYTVRHALFDAAADKSQISPSAEGNA